MFPFFTPWKHQKTLPKTPENLWFSGVFSGYKMWTLARTGLMEKKNMLGSFFDHEDQSLKMILKF